MNGVKDTFAAVYDHLKTLPENERFINHMDSGEWKHCSRSKFLETVRYLTLAFDARGWRNKQIALVIDPSVYWLMIDYALMLSGAVSVPLFTNISTKNLRFEIKDAGVEIAFTQTREQVRIIGEANPDVVCIDIDATCTGCVSIETMSREGKEIDQKSPQLFEELLYGITPEDVITIVYTSGTSGLPKGVELTQLNLISQIHDTGVKYKFDLHKDTALSFLPLAHIFERMVMHFYISTGMSVYFVDDVKNLGVIIKTVHPTVMTTVPRLLEKVYAKMQQKAKEESLLKRWILKLAFYRANHKDIDAKNGWIDVLLDKLVYQKFRASLGGSLRMIISGGAALSPDLNRFFFNIGIPVYQGYGLTESSPVICANAPGENKIGTCGKHFFHTEVKLSSEGELLARGPGIMHGYHNNPKATKAAIDTDGWLYTGDLAKIDDEGYITITGRKKDLAKTSTGEFISVEYIEQLLVSSGLFEYVLVVGDNKPFVSVLLIVDAHNGKEKVASVAFQKEIQRLIKTINRKLNEWEKIRNFHLSTEVLSIEAGDLTPSMKLVRDHVQERFSDAIEQMYEGHI